MTPTVEEPKLRRYYILLKSREEEIVVKAEILCRPDGNSNFYRLKQDGQVVAEFLGNDVISWRVEQD